MAVPPVRDYNSAPNQPLMLSRCAYSKYASRVGRVELLKDDTVFCVFFPLPSLIMEQWGTPSIQKAKVCHAGCSGMDRQGQLTSPCARDRAGRASHGLRVSGVVVRQTGGAQLCVDGCDGAAGG